MNRIRCFAQLVLYLVLIFCAAGAHGQSNDLPVIDFVKVYPHMIWVSSEGRDQEYPQGFRYKLLSVRRDDTQTVEFVLLREVPGQAKVVAIHAEGPVSKFEQSTRGVLDRLGRKLNISFEQFDLRAVTNFDEFNAKIAAFGWSSSSVYQ